MSVSASAKIHPTAIVEDGAILGENVSVGPFSHIGPNVKIGSNSKIMNHVVVEGFTDIGEGATIFHHAIIGGAPQNTKHMGGPTKLIVGKNCLIREGVTMHTGSDTSTGVTTIGDNCTFLAYAHVAHDCTVGNNVTFANNVLIAGHVVIGDYVIIGGAGAVHQFCRVGHHAFVGGVAALAHDLIPYGSAIGVQAHLAGLNIIGMKRSGMPRPEIHAIRGAVKMLFDRRKPVRENAVDVAAAYEHSPAVKDLLTFMDFSSKRSYCAPLLSDKTEGAGDDDI